MKQIYPDLWQTVAEHPFPTLTTHAYLLVREEGNVLFYSTGHAHEHRHIADLGGLTRQYLSHKDEVGPALGSIKDMFGSTLCCHRLEVEAVEKESPVDLAFDSREVHLGNIEVIPTPGHTPGSTCYLVSSPHGGSYLFTGDTIFVGRDGNWTDGYLEGMSDRATLKESLELLRGLTPDVVLSSASLATPPYREVTPETWQAGVDDALRSLA